MAAARVAAALQTLDLLAKFADLALLFAPFAQLTLEAVELVSQPLHVLPHVGTTRSTMATASWVATIVGMSRTVVTLVLAAALQVLKFAP